MNFRKGKSRFGARRVPGRTRRQERFWPVSRGRLCVSKTSSVLIV